MSQDLSKYFTGDRCVRDHVSPRYTQSGACCQCVRERSGGAPIDTPAPPAIPRSAVDYINAQRKLNAEREDALGALVEIKLWSYASDIDELRDTAAACCVGTHPCLTVEDVRTTYGPTATRDQLGHYRVRVPLEHVQFMRDLSQVRIDNHEKECVANDLEKSRALLDDLLRAAGQVKQ
jgi:hypothetical protein